VDGSGAECLAVVHMCGRGLEVVRRERGLARGRAVFHRAEREREREKRGFFSLEEEEALQDQRA